MPGSHDALFATLLALFEVKTGFNATGTPPLGYLTEGEQAGPGEATAGC